MFRCTSCRLWFLDPLPTPEEVASFYPKDYACYEDLQKPPGSRLVRLAREIGLRRLTRPVDRLMEAPGRLLDVGCGTGAFLAAMRDRGWDVRGVEPNRSAANHARGRLGLAVHEGALASGLFPPRSFDVVTLWHVLEHLPDPADTLRTVAGLVRPGGWLVLAVPHLESWDARMFGPHWSGLDIPRHLYLFPRATLARYLCECGFTVVRMECSTGARAGVISSLVLQSEAWFPGRRLRAAFKKVVTSMVGRGMFSIYGWIARIAVRSSFLTVYARRVPDRRVEDVPGTRVALESDIRRAHSKWGAPIRAAHPLNPPHAEVGSLCRRARAAAVLPAGEVESDLR